MSKHGKNIGGQFSRDRGRVDGLAQSTGSPIAGREVINPRCDGCGAPGQWPLHADGQSHLCQTCGSTKTVNEVRAASGGPVIEDRTYVVGEQPGCAGILPIEVVRKLEGAVQRPEFSDIELAAISFVLDNINSPVPPGLMEHLRSVKQKLTQYARERA